MTQLDSYTVQNCIVLINCLVDSIEGYDVIRDSLYIGGQWTGADRDRPMIDVENPATTDKIGAVPAGTHHDVDDAVNAAQRALTAMAAMRPAERAALLEALADAIDSRKEALAQTITAEVGTPIRISRAVQAGLPVRTLRATAEALRLLPFVETVGNSTIHHVPVGVVGAITPWNYPLHQIIGKVAGAFAAGAPVILKPSELAPLNAFALADLIHEIGWPEGAFSLVSGTGTDVGASLVGHPGVDMISFTGSTVTGARIGAAASATNKRLAMELGGKSASVVLPDADMAVAVKVSVSNAFLNSGQTCTAWTRLLVPAEGYDEAATAAVAAARRFTPADPTSDDCRLGPLVSAAARDKTVGYIDIAREEGAHVLCGGEIPAEMRGYYVQPTVLGSVKPGSRVEQEEIFGPVLVILPYRDIDEAVRIANGTSYGLAAGVWSADTDLAAAVARRLRAGQVDVNGAAFNPAAPFGGFGQSGHAREFGSWGIAEFLTTQSIQV